MSAWQWIIRHCVRDWASERAREKENERKRTTIGVNGRVTLNYIFFRQRVKSIIFSSVLVLAFIFVYTFRFVIIIFFFSVVRSFFSGGYIYTICLAIERERVWVEIRANGDNVCMLMNKQSAVNTRKNPKKRN